MCMTFSIPDIVAKKFCSKVPTRTRSRLVTQWILAEIAINDNLLEQACISANADENLERVIQEWQCMQEPVVE